MKTAILFFVISLTMDVEASLHSDRNITMESLNALKGPVNFFVARPKPLTGTVKKIFYTEVILNENDVFWQNISTFVAPFDGIYQFFISFQTCKSRNTTSWKLNVNNVPMATCRPRSTSRTLAETMCTYMTTLKRRHIVTVSQDQGCAWANVTSHTITFSGMLLR